MTTAVTDRIVVTSPSAGSLDGLTHLLWCDPSVRAVLVQGDDTTATDIAAYAEQVRVAIELTGSGAVLLMSC